MELSLGGLLYTGIPFSGWYADSEIVRNMTDESRYNQLPVIAQRLGMSTANNRNLWRDAALVVLNQAGHLLVFPLISLSEVALGLEKVAADELQM